MLLPAMFYIHKNSIFLLSIFLTHPYKNRSPTPITPPQFAPLYRTSSPLIAVPKALPWQIKSTFIIISIILHAVHSLYPYHLIIFFQILPVHHTIFLTLLQSSFHLQKTNKNPRVRISGACICCVPMNTYYHFVYWHYIICNFHFQYAYHQKRFQFLLIFK